LLQFDATIHLKVGWQKVGPWTAGCSCSSLIGGYSVESADQGCDTAVDAEKVEYLTTLEWWSYFVVEENEHHHPLVA